eukprot:TRINITY_DN45057_c0_g1_i5.p1 TRINITY_DN45057_c0_g1~~TRINITY_DN45057_c0_g1_i5.p1  ORF type:complete len:201 (+),score=-11.64 TRINITY_DN45057_c0_g1_i5:334-936(+)
MSYINTYVAKELQLLVFQNMFNKQLVKNIPLFSTKRSFLRGCSFIGFLFFTNILLYQFFKLSCKFSQLLYASSRLVILFIFEYPFLTILQKVQYHCQQLSVKRKVNFISKDGSQCYSKNDAWILYVCVYRVLFYLYFLKENPANLYRSMIVFIGLPNNEVIYGFRILVLSLQLIFFSIVQKNDKISILYNSLPNICYIGQ